jgi:hypothetical protein
VKCDLFGLSKLSHSNEDFIKRKLSLIVSSYLLNEKRCECTKKLR